MPFFQAMAERANVIFDRNNITGVNLNNLQPGLSLGEIADALGIATTQDEKDYLDGWPPALQEAIRAVLLSAVTQTPRVPVCFSWAPAYDYELHLWEARSTANSPGGITVFLRSRYPDD